MRPPGLHSSSLPVIHPPTIDASQISAIISSVFTTSPDQSIPPNVHLAFTALKDSLTHVNTNGYSDVVTAILLDMASREPGKLFLGLSSRNLYSTPLFAQLASFYGNPARDGSKFQELLSKLSSVDQSRYTPAVFGKVLQTYFEKFDVPMARATEVTGGPFKVAEFVGDDGSPRNAYHDASAAEWCRNVVARLRASSSISDDFTPNLLKAVLVLLGRHSRDLLEEFLGLFLKKFVADELLANKRSNLATSVLDAMTSLPSSNSGPIVDCIELMLPNVDVNQLLKLVFSRKPDTNISDQFYTEYVPHLMSILLHEASWSNLQYCFSWILQKDRALQVHI